MPLSVVEFNSCVHFQGKQDDGVLFFFCCQATNVLHHIIFFLEQKELCEDLWILVGRGEGAALASVQPVAAAGSPSALGWCGGRRRFCQVRERWEGMGWSGCRCGKKGLNVKSASELVLQPSAGCMSLGDWGNWGRSEAFRSHFIFSCRIQLFVAQFLKDTGESLWSQRDVYLVQFARLMLVQTAVVKLTVSSVWL